MSISGDVIQTWPASGRNAVYITNQSGNFPVYVRGDNTDAQSVGAGSLSIFGPTAAIDETATTLLRRIRSTASGSVGSASGTTYRLLTDTIMHGSTLRTGDFVRVGSQSGGVPLTTNTGLTVNGIKLKVDNAAIHIGSSINPPYESGGFSFGTGFIIDLPIDNPNNIRLWTQVSGNAIVSWMGFDL